MPHNDHEPDLGAASGIATLDGSTKVVEDPASATTTPGGAAIPIADGSGKLAAGWGGAASSLATLNGSTKVVEDPASASATSGAAVIPIADGSGQLAAGFGGAASTLATLNGSTLVVENPASASTTSGAGVIPIADGSGQLAAGFGGAASTLATLNASSKVVEDPASKLIPRWLKFTVAETAFTAAATTEDIELFALAAGGVIHGVKVKHSASFTGGGLTAFTVSVGISGELAKYASAFDVFQAAANTTFQLSNSFGSENHGATTSIRIAAASTTANVADATAGSVDVWVLVSEVV